MTPRREFLDLGTLNEAGGVHLYQRAATRWLDNKETKLFAAKQVRSVFRRNLLY